LYTEGWKYVLYERGRYREQLFDLQADPGEMVNLAVESRHAATLDDHRQRLAAWCRAMNDPYARQRSRMPPGTSVAPTN